MPWARTWLDVNRFDEVASAKRGLKMYGAFEADLRELADRGRLRSLRERSGIDFTSNDYLGLAESAELRQAAADAERRERLARLVRFAGNELRRRCNLESSGSHIVPVIVGADQAAVALAAALQRKGYDIRAIRPPTVPEGTARLRIALTLNVDEPTVAGLFEALSEHWRKAA